MSAYKHKDLGPEPDAIRLLTVDACRENDTYISCTLTEARLNNPDLDYIAISHLWSTDRPSFMILLNGSSFFVTPQLWQFLHLATQRVPGCPLWIDAICIEQVNTADKERQIPLMGQIYACAREFIAWLPSSVDCAQVSSVAGDPNMRAACDIADGRKSLFQHIESGGETMAALTRLFYHEYWGRIWIVQELRLSKGKSFWWEGQVIESERLTDLAAAFKDVSSTSYGKKIEDDLWDFFCHLNSITSAEERLPSFADHMILGPCESSYVFKGKDAKKPLHELVVEHGEFKCCLQKDHVYALLGLANCGDQVKVNYDLLDSELLLTIWLVSGRPLRDNLRGVITALGMKDSKLPLNRHLKQWQDLLDEVATSVYAWFAENDLRAAAEPPRSLVGITGASHDIETIQEKQWEGTHPFKYRELLDWLMYVKSEMNAADFFLPGSKTFHRMLRSMTGWGHRDRLRRRESWRRYDQWRIRSVYQTNDVHESHFEIEILRIVGDDVPSSYFRAYSLGHETVDFEPSQEFLDMLDESKQPWDQAERWIVPMKRKPSQR